MNNPYYLVIGGSSVAGQAAIQAIRRQVVDARIAATASGANEVPGVDVTIKGIDLNATDAVRRVIDSVEEVPRALFFTPAFGPLGYPVVATPPDDVKSALKFSFDPMVELARELTPGITVGFSAFYWLPHTLAAYGSMAYVKIAQEKVAIENPNTFRMVRAGSFRSNATRGIGLLLQRAVRDTEHEPIRKLGEAWKQSGKKFGDFFFDFACACEKEAFGSGFKEPHRQTEPRDIEKAVEKILNGEKAPIVNVIGDWIWLDDALPKLPVDFRLLGQPKG